VRHRHQPGLLRPLAAVTHRAPGYCWLRTEVSPALRFGRKSWVDQKIQEYPGEPGFACAPGPLLRGTRSSWQERMEYRRTDERFLWSFRTTDFEPLYRVSAGQMSKRTDLAAALSTRERGCARQADCLEKNLPHRLLFHDAHDAIGSS
jgi:hypothetical protein